MHWNREVASISWNWCIKLFSMALDCYWKVEFHVAVELADFGSIVTSGLYLVFYIFVLHWVSGRELPQMALIRILMKLYLRQLSWIVSESLESMRSKQQRAYGGCLGVRRLWKAWKTAKSLGELSNERWSQDSWTHIHWIHRCVWPTRWTETSK